MSAIHICNTKGGSYPSGHVCAKSNGHSNSGYPSDRGSATGYQGSGRDTRSTNRSSSIGGNTTNENKNDDTKVCKNDICTFFLQSKADGTPSFKNHPRGSLFYRQREAPLIETLKSSPHFSTLSPNLTFLSFKDKNLTFSEMYTISTLLRNHQLPVLRKLDLSENKTAQSWDVVNEFAIYFAMPGSSLVSLDLSYSDALYRLGIHYYRDLALCLGMAKRHVYVKLFDYPLISNGLLSSKDTMNYMIFDQMKSLRYDGSGSINVRNVKTDSLTLKILKEGGANRNEFYKSPGAIKTYEIKSLSDALKNIYSGKRGLTDTCIQTQIKSMKVGIGLVSCVLSPIDVTGDELTAIQYGSFFQLPIHKASAFFGYVSVGVCMLDTLNNQQITPDDLDCIAPLEELHNGWFTP